MTKQLEKVNPPFIGPSGKEIPVYKAILEGVECFFVENEIFDLDEINPNIYGPDDDTNKRRFLTFSGLASDILYQMQGNDIIHLHDWHVAGVALKMTKEHEEEWKKGILPPIVFTFHNNNRCAQGRSFVGIYNYDPIMKALQETGVAKDHVNLFAKTLQIADAITTVSETFGLDSQLPELGEGVSPIVRHAAKVGKFAGIINGANTARWNPENDKSLKNWTNPVTGGKIDLSYGCGREEDVFQKKIEAKKQLQNWLIRYLPTGLGGIQHLNDQSSNLRFQLDSSKPIVTYIGRFDSYQKGLDKLEEAIESTLKNGGQFILMGSQEDPEATKILDQLENKYATNVLFIRDFKDPSGNFYYQQGGKDRPGVGSIIRAASDFLYVPSRFEPCGLVQYEGWLFGSQVIGSNTGGLADTIIAKEEDDQKFNGYLFERNAMGRDSAFQVVENALEDWHNTSNQDKNQLAKRLIKEGRQYSWATSPQGLSPAMKYRYIYQKAIQRVQFRDKSELLGRFDFNEYLHQSKQPQTKPADSVTLKEEAYLYEYYFGTKSDKELEKLYLALPLGFRSQLPSPYNQRINFENYQKLGSHLDQNQAVFTVDAPQAKKVSVILYDENEHLIEEVPLVKNSENQWTTAIRGCQHRQRYHYRVNGQIKIDPYGVSHVYSSDVAKTPYSVVCDRQSFKWTDREWVDLRFAKAGQPQPFSIYELYPAAWKRKESGEPLNYRELALELVKHCKQGGFTHIELMGILEHASEDSMGYQVTGFFAPNSRMGTPDDFKYMINHLHENQIGVFLDWVPAHFAKNEYALRQFDGTRQFESSLINSLFSKRNLYDWGTVFFDYSKESVRSFLISNAVYWLKELHIDGLRVDAVRCMLDSENQDAAKLFLRELNAVIHSHCQGAITIAEEYSGDISISKPFYAEGLGFDMKWNVGWMHHTLSYFSMPINKRKYMYGELTKAIEGDMFHKMVLAFSHDEVKEGMKSLLNKTKGLKADQRYANVRAMISFMMCIPGKKLNFMGNELGLEEEWTTHLGKKRGIMDRELSQEGKQIFQMCADLNAIYTGHKSFWEKDENGHDLNWIEKGTEESSIFAYYRGGAHSEQIACFHNFASDESIEYIVPLNKLSKKTLLTELFNSNSPKYGGKGPTNQRIDLVHDEKGEIKGYKIIIPPLSTVVIQESLELT